MEKCQFCRLLRLLKTIREKHKRYYSNKNNVRWSYSWIQNVTQHLPTSDVPTCTSCTCTTILRITRKFVMRHSQSIKLYLLLTFNVKEGNQVNISKWWMLDCYARAFTNKKHNIYFFSWQLRKLNMTLWHGWMEVLKIGTFTCYGWDEHKIHYRLCRYIHLNIIQRAVLQKWFCFRM